VAARLVAAHSSASVAGPRHGGLDGRRLKQAIEFIEANLTAELTLMELATVVGMSVSHFRAGFRDSIGVPVHQYVMERRLERGKALLMRGDHSTAELVLTRWLHSPEPSGSVTTSFSRSDRMDNLLKLHI
jgi:AraC family transcriptional regulator